MHNQHVIPLAKKYLVSLLGEFYEDKGSFYSMSVLTTLVMTLVTYGRS